MKPIDLYNREPELIDNDINILRGCYYNHIPEIDETMCQFFDKESVAKNNRIKIKIYKDFNFDGRRFWRLASIWLDDKPVMIIQNAGREGDDHEERFITNKELYVEMIKFIQTLVPSQFDEIPDIVDENDDIIGLDEFYGNKLDGHFERY
jgi:hypothetical protein